MTHTNYSNTKSILIVGSIVALGILALANPAAASHNDDDITVNSHNRAAVANDVYVGSNTGSNAAVGGYTRAGGEGGDARGHDATGGEGGNSGDAGNSGNINTGDATAIGTVNNDVNRNSTVVNADNCGCEDRRGGDITVRSSNHSYVGNALDVHSNTGENVAAGGETGAGGDGGDASSSYAWYHYWNNMNVATGGDAGDSGDADNEGSITTGNAYSDGFVINTVNRNVTRIVR